MSTKGVNLESKIKLHPYISHNCNILIKTAFCMTSIER